MLSGVQPGWHKAAAGAAWAFHPWQGTPLVLGAAACQIKPPSLHVLPTTLCRREIDLTNWIANATYWIANRTTPAAALSSLTPALDKLPRLRRLGLMLALTGTLPAEWAAPNSLLR